MCCLFSHHIDRSTFNLWMVYKVPEWIFSKLLGLRCFAMVIVLLSKACYFLLLLWLQYSIFFSFDDKISYRASWNILEIFRTILKTFIHSVWNISQSIQIHRVREATQSLLWFIPMAESSMLHRSGFPIDVRHGHEEKRKLAKMPDWIALEVFLKYVLADFNPWQMLDVHQSMCALCVCWSKQILCVHILLLYTFMSDSCEIVFGGKTFLESLQRSNPSLFHIGRVIRWKIEFIPCTSDKSHELHNKYVN